MSEFTHVDLCSGIGGFSLAAWWAGFQTILHCEIDPYCQKVLAKNFPEVPIHDDIHALTGISSADLLTGGPPCQPFSNAGKRVGTADDRHLWPEMLRIIDASRPTWCVIENVDGFTGMALDLVWSDLESANYEVGAVVFPASAVGAWHRRDRLWVIAHTQSVGCGSGRSWRSLASTSGKQQQTLSTRETPDGREYRVDQWTSEPSVDRMVPGLPSELDICRRRAIGNSIVPQQAFPVLRAIADSLRLERSA